MFKFFRIYQKQILTVGITLLMIAFLVGPTLSMFQPSPEKEPLGTIEGEEITLADQHRGTHDLAVLKAIAPVLEDLAGADEPLKWVLMLRDAQAMGLSASDAEADQLLDVLNQVREQSEQPAMTYTELATRFGTTPDAIRTALVRWLVIQQYRELIQGYSHINNELRLTHTFFAQQYMQMGYVQGFIDQLMASQGRTRSSEPLRRWFVHDQYAGLGVTILPISHERYMAKTETPDEATLLELFDRYKDNEPGTGEPHGFGYKVPDRVKIEFLTVPANRARKTISIDEADALAYFDRHRDEFPSLKKPADENTPAESTPADYSEARPRVIDKLREQRADALCETIIKSARAMLLEDARQLAEAGGYREVKPGWTPMSLSDVAARLHEKFGIQPDITRIDDLWLTARDLVQLSGIGGARLNREPQSPFLQYVMSARTFLQAAAEEENTRVDERLRPLRLQTGLPSFSLRSIDGGRHLFRLIEASPAHSPASMDDTRDQVTTDARRLAAYRALCEDADTWLEQAKQESLEELAARTGTELIKPAPFPKRQATPQGGLAVPSVEGIGRDEDFIDGLFDGCSALIDSGADLDQTPAAERLIALPVDSRMFLAVARADKYTSITAKQYEEVAAAPQLDTMLMQLLRGELAENPFDYPAINARTGFAPADEDE